jgi:hypothetical protein
MTQVIIQDIIPRTQLVAAAGQTVFNTNWTADASTDIDVYARADGVPPDDATQLVSPSLYNVTFVGGSQTVRVTFLSGRTLDDVITIVRNTPATRTNLYINTNFVPSMLNQDFGILTLIDQQAQMYDTVVNPGYNVSATIDEKDKILPILGAQQTWRMNEAGTAIESFTIDNIPAPSNSYFITYGTDPALENEQNLALLGDGILKQTVALGFATLAIAIPGVDYLDPGTPLGTMAFQDADNVNITGGVGNFNSGTVAASPVFSTDLVNKAYADSISAGFTFKSACLATTTTNLSATYANGAAGVGATLTATGNGVLTMDGVNPGVASRVCITDQTNTFENGIYTVTDAGSVGTPWIITRATDFDTSAEIVPGAITFIQDGTLYGDTSFVQTEVVLTVGTDPILFVQFSQQYPLSMGNGGTGSIITPIANAVFSTSAGSVGQLSTTLPSGLTIPGYATSGANSNITSLIGLTGVLQAPTFVNDSLGAHVLGFSSAGGTPVNYINMTNAISTAYPVLEVLGTDTNIAFPIKAKGNGIIQLIGGSGTVTPLGIYSGTAYQHVTLMNFSNTSAVRNVTFQDADGTLAFMADRGYVLLSTATASNSAALTFTNVTGYSNYMLVFNALTPQTNGVVFAMQGSTDNGSTWLSTAGSYFQQSLFYTNAAVAAGSDVTTLTFAVLSSSVVNTVPGPSGFILLENLNGGTRKGYNGQLTYVNSSTSTMAGITYAGWIATSTVVNAVRLVYSSGNIVSGTAQLYGLK